MPKKVTPLSINLLPGKQPSFAERFLNFSLTFGRYIIIGTEIIVLVAFFSRFKLDHDFIDLNDQIKKKQAILAGLRPVEEKVDQLQLRLSQIKIVQNAQKGGIFALPAVDPLTPEDITYKSITVNQDKITIVGLAKETGTISQFVTALKSSSVFEKESVVLESIERTTTEDFLTFTITALAKKGS